MSQLPPSDNNLLCSWIGYGFRNLSNTKSLHLPHIKDGMIIKSNDYPFCWTPVQAPSRTHRGPQTPLSEAVSLLPPNIEISVPIVCDFISPPSCIGFLLQKNILNILKKNKSSINPNKWFRHLYAFLSLWQKGFDRGSSLFEV